MRPTRCSILIALSLAFTVTACSDPYSQRRIKSRVEHLNFTAERIGHREADGVRRVHEADETLRKSWKHDCERFEQRLPTVGDYVW